MKKFVFTLLIIIFLFFLISPTFHRAEAVELKNPSNVEVSVTGFQTAIGNVTKVFVGIIGSVALMMFVYGGFTMLTSGGNPEKITAGKQIVIWSILGIIAVMGSYVVLNTIIKALTGGFKAGV